MTYKIIPVIILLINLPSLVFAGVINGTVYQDDNNNDVYDSNTDIGLGNITVSLYDNNGTPANKSDDTFLKNTVTDLATGFYQLTELDINLNYRLEVSENDEDLPLGASIGTNNPLTNVTVTAETPTANQDFGFDQQKQFSCENNLYVAHGESLDVASTLSTIDSSQSPFVLAPMLANPASQAYHYNAMGYREQDNYIYAVKSASNHILRLGSDGSVVDLGAAISLPTPTNVDNAYDAGAVFMDGDFYVHRKGADDVVYQIDVMQSPPQVVATHSLTYAEPPHQAANIAFGDFVYNIRDNKVYAVSDQGSVLMIDPITWRVSVIGDSADPAVYGAAYSDNEGKVYVYQQNAGALYQVDVGSSGSGSGTLSRLSSMPSIDFYDGTSCPSSKPDFAQPDLRLEKKLADGQPIVVNPNDPIMFTLTVTNDGNAAVSDIYLTDYIPNTLTLNDSAWELSGDNKQARLKIPIAQLAPNESQSVNIRFTANSELRIGGIVITDEAECKNAAEISSFVGSADRDSIPDQIDGNDFAEDDYDVATVTINGLCEAQYDFGDAPDQASGSSYGNYQTLETDNGARHAVSELLYLGSCVDTDDGGSQYTDKGVLLDQANADDLTKSNYILEDKDKKDGTYGTCATEHDDEDSLQAPSFSDNQTSPTVDVTVVNKTSQATTLSCWVDYNGDGRFDNATERGQASVPPAAGAQIITVTLPDVPATAGYDTKGISYMRCRLASANGADNPIGSAADGEVEDYKVTITSHCSLDATISNLQCDDQGTTDSTDDTWSFEQTITGTDVAPSTTWQASGDISSSGVYAVAQTHQVGLIAEKSSLNILYSDTDDASCKVEAETFFAPPSCSGDCALFVTSGDPAIDDQGTTATMDDELVIPLTVTGIRPANAAWQVYRRVAGAYSNTAIYSDQGNKTVVLRLLVSEVLANDPDGVMLRIQQVDYSDCLQEVFINLPNLAQLKINKILEGAPAPNDWQFTLRSDNCPLPDGLVNPVAVSGAGGQAYFTDLSRYTPEGQPCLYTITENEQSNYILNTALSDPLSEINLLSANSVMVNIINSQLAYVFINDAQILEGDTGSRDLIFDVLLSSSATRTMRVLRDNGNGNDHCNDGHGQDDINNPHCNNGVSTTTDFNVIAGTAGEGVDYEVVASGTVTIPEGDSSTTISVPVIGDLLVEEDETFTIQLSNVVNGILVDGIATGTIIDDDAAACQADTLHLIYSDGRIDALDALGNQIASDSAPFAGYQVSDEYVAIAGVNNELLILHDNGTISAIDHNGASVSNAYTGLQGFSEYQGIAVDRRSQRLLLLHSDGTIHVYNDQGVRDQNHPFNGLKISDEYVDIAYDSTRNHLLIFHDGGDLDAINSNGERVDTPYDDTDSVKQLSEYQGITFGLCGEIEPPNDAINISVSHVASLEGNDGVTSLSVVVSLDKPAPVGGVSVDYATSDGTATRSNNDYQTNSGSLTIPEGATQAVISVDIIGDLVVEEDETFFLNLSNPVNASLADGYAILTIINDDGVVGNCAQIIAVEQAELMPEDAADCVTIPHEEPTPTVSISRSSVLEGDSGTTTLAFKVTLSEPAPSTGISFDYTSVDQSATLGNNDYQAVSGTLSLPAGVTQGVIEVLINGDTDVETDETFILNFANPQHAILGDSSTVGTIINDDGMVGNCAQIIAVEQAELMPANAVSCVTIPHEEPIPTVSISRSSVLEGDSGTTTLAFRVTLSEPAPSTGISFDYTSVDQSATLGNNDYQAVSGTLSLPAGATQGVIEVLINGDTDVEADETFILNFANPQHAILDKTSTIGTIINDDGLVVANCAQLIAVDQLELLSSNNTQCVNTPRQDVRLCEGLQGYWQLNEPIGQTLVADASGNEQSLPLINMDAYNDWGNGKLSGALSFDGVNDYVQRDTVSAGLQPAQVTVAAWIKVTEGSWQWVASQGDNYGLYLNNHSDLVFYFYNGSSWPSVSATSLNFTDGQWHHVVGTYDGSQLKVYFDGVNLASNAESAAIVYNRGAEVSLGAMQGNRLFKGQLDDVRIYDRALNDDEINTLYQSPQECPSQAPVNLRLRKTANKSTVYSGDEVVFTLSVTNVGSTTASQIVTSDLLPDGFVYLSDNGNGAYQAENGEWLIEQIHAGETMSIEITTQVQ